MAAVTIAKNAIAFAAKSHVLHKIRLMRNSFAHLYHHNITRWFGAREEHRFVLMLFRSLALLLPQSHVLIRYIPLTASLWRSFDRWWRIPDSDIKSESIFWLSISLYEIFAVRRSKWVLLRWVPVVWGSHCEQRNLKEKKTTFCSSSICWTKEENIEIFDMNYDIFCVIWFCVNDLDKKFIWA